MDSKLSATMPHYLLLANFLGECWDRNKSIKGRNFTIGHGWVNSTLQANKTENFWRDPVALA